MVVHKVKSWGSVVHSCGQSDGTLEMDMRMIWVFLFKILYFT
jgi:hypothetical protein